MPRFFVILGVMFLAIGLLWPLASKIGLGRLPGDFVIERGSVTIYLPITSSILVSIALSAVFWAVGTLFGNSGRPAP